MTITFQCEHCGKKIEAPDALGGKRGKCPYCKQSNYIPAVVSDDELIDFAPENTAEERRRLKEIQALRNQEKGLIAEMGGSETPSVPLENRERVNPEDLYHLVVNYCLDLADSKLEQAGAHLAKLQEFPVAAEKAVEDFISGKAIEPALDRIPTKVLNGFLKKLSIML
ncbi:MAG: hypothetical protein SVV80_09785 [Planctomycetota bacterium]|nr:hypothetical protein [Planctomycetota bacterium]